jgi:acetyl-CoA carboxylase biotin carboxyl carrier protein
MRIEEVRRLIRLVEESEIGELEVWKWWGRIRIRKGSAPNGNAFQVMASGNMAAPSPDPPKPAQDLAGQAAMTASAPEPAPDAAEGLTPITSPMVGTFYRAPAPDADPYVATGDEVELGQTVCIIEAMKLMNEIQSEVRGKVVKVLVENQQPVEFGQALFLVREN